MSAVQSAEKRIDTHRSNVFDLPTANEPDKALATLKAGFALAGHQVYDGYNRDFLVTRWGMSRYCQDFADLQAFARKLGIKP